jgi:hypothetical protein
MKELKNTTTRGLNPQLQMSPIRLKTAKSKNLFCGDQMMNFLASKHLPNHLALKEDNRTRNEMSILSLLEPL